MDNPDRLSPMKAQMLRVVWGEYGLLCGPESDALNLICR